MKKKVIDSRRTLFVFETEDALIQYAIDHFVQTAQSALQERNRFCIALSGGSTPKHYLKALTGSKKAQALDWKKGYIFFSDERAVPPTDDESNYKMAMQFLQNAPFKNAHFFRMQAEREDREAASKEYENQILKHCPNGIFDIVYLGIGTDGHTASLFPETSVLNNTIDFVQPNFVSALHTWRMTFTFPLINKAKNIVVLAVGDSKALIVREILNDGDQYPAHRIGTSANPALFFCDKKASSLWSR